jgi:hypothetical protein
VHLSYETFRYGKDERVKERVDEFVYEAILYEEDRHGDTTKTHLENQPKLICEAMGRLMGILLEKGVINLDEFKEVCGLNWGKKADTLQIVKEEED